MRGKEPEGLRQALRDAQEYLKNQETLFGGVVYRTGDAADSSRRELPKESQEAPIPDEPAPPSREPGGEGTGRTSEEKLAEPTPPFAEVRHAPSASLHSRPARRAEVTAQEAEEDLFGGPARTPAVQEAWQSVGTLEEQYQLIKDCQKCPLGATRTKFVFGVGSPDADVIFVGEAPGADEDLQGEPFVGRAGQLLNKILEAVRLKREEVYIANILKCRPPNNREPLPSEMETCSLYLLKQIELIKPKILVALGRVAAQELLHTTESLARLREAVHRFHSIPTVVTYHPAALLRNPNWKRPAWEDFKKFRALYDELTGATSPSDKTKRGEQHA